MQQSNRQTMNTLVSTQPSADYSTLQTHSHMLFPQSAGRWDTEKAEYGLPRLPGTD